MSPKQRDDKRFAVWLAAIVAVITLGVNLVPRLFEGDARAAADMQIEAKVPSIIQETVWPLIDSAIDRRTYPKEKGCVLEESLRSIYKTQDITSKSMDRLEHKLDEIEKLLRDLSTSNKKGK